jgi:hypothetical protein
MGFVHAGLVTLLRRAPHLIVEILIAHGLLPARTYRIRQCPTEVFIPRPGDRRVSERRADVVLEISLEGSNQRWGIIVEVQLAEDDGKYVTWSVFYAAYLPDLGEHMFLVALTLDADVAEWLREDATSLIENMRVFVLGPDRFPIWHDFDVDCEPERTLLMAMVAVGEDERRMRLPAAIQALQYVRGLDRVIYTEMLLSHFEREMLMNAAEQVPFVDPEFQERLRRYRPTPRERASMMYTHARQEGCEDGRIEQQLRAIQTVLEHRGLRLEPGSHERMLACRDLSTLERWFERSLIIDRAEALFE